MNVRGILSSLAVLMLMAASLLSLPLWGCMQPDPPGERVASYLYAGTLESNECGEAAFPAVDPMEVRVELRQDDTLAIWRRPGAAIAHGVVEEDGTWRFTIFTQHPAYEGCAFVQEERIELHDVGGEAPTSTVAVNISTAPGYDCTPSHIAAGGPFVALPCRASWSLEGEVIAPLFGEP